MPALSLELCTYARVYVHASQVGFVMAAVVAAAAAVSSHADLDSIARGVDRLAAAARPLLATGQPRADKFRRAVDALYALVHGHDVKGGGAEAESGLPKAVAPIRPANVLDAAVMEDAKLRVCDFLMEHVDGPDVEVEARLGTLWSPQTQTRFRPEGVDVLCSWSADHDTGTQFNASVPLSVFRHLMTCLEARVALQPQLVTVTKTVTTDTRYNDGLRVSYVGGRPVQAIRKERLANKEFTTQPGQLDFRISASRETPFDVAAVTALRANMTVDIDSTVRKERTSFRIEAWSVDMTDINHGSEYQVEVEIWDKVFLAKQRALCKEGKPNKLAWLAEGTLSNIRTLAFYANGKVPRHLQDRVNAMTMATAVAPPLLPPTPSSPPRAAAPAPAKRLRLV